MSRDLSCGNVKPTSVLPPLPSLPPLPVSWEITALSDYASLDGYMYFWDIFKGQSHAQQFACVIFIPRNAQHQPISDLWLWGITELTPDQGMAREGCSSIYSPRLCTTDSIYRL